MLQKAQKLVEKRERIKERLGKLKGSLAKVAAAEQKLAARKTKLMADKAAATEALEQVEREQNDIMAEAQRVIEATAAANTKELQ